MPSVTSTSNGPAGCLPCCSTACRGSIPCFQSVHRHRGLNKCGDNRLGDPHFYKTINYDLCIVCFDRTEKNPYVLPITSTYSIAGNGDCSVTTTGYPEPGDPLYDCRGWSFERNYQLSNEDTTADLVDRIRANMPEFPEFPADFRDGCQDSETTARRGDGYYLLFDESKWRIAYTPPTTGYLKVWIKRTFTPGEGGTPTVTRQTYEWENTGNSTVYTDSVVELVPADLGVTLIQVEKYSFVRGYEPEIIDGEPIFNGCPPILGCTDRCSSNYNPLANKDDGSCNNDNANCPSGCTDSCSSNYNPSAVYDDGSCNGDNANCPSGCTDYCSSNWNPYAVIDDGSCNNDNANCQGWY